MASLDPRCVPRDMKIMSIKETLVKLILTDSRTGALDVPRPWQLVRRGGEQPLAKSAGGRYPFSQNTDHT